MTLNTLTLLLWHLLGTLAFTVVYLRYLPVPAGSGWVWQIAVILPLSVVSAMLFYSVMSWLVV